jgi:hypothetical protein
VLWALRSGRRRWRLDLADWHALALGLLQGDTAARVARVHRVALAVLLRGKVLAERPQVRGNPDLLRSIAEATAALPEADVALLLDKWCTLTGPAATRAAVRVLRHGGLGPPRKDSAGTAARRFALAMLSQALLDTMPNSYPAWIGPLRRAVEKLPEDRARVLADALALPRSLAGATISHVILQLVSPDQADSDAGGVFAYLEPAREVRWATRMPLMHVCSCHVQRAPARCGAMCGACMQRMRADVARAGGHGGGRG